MPSKRDEYLLEEQGRHSVYSTCHPPMWSGFHSGHMWVKFVVGSLLCSERFSLGSLVFSFTQNEHF